MSSIPTLLALGLLVAFGLLLNNVSASLSSHHVHICRRHFRDVAFKKVGGVARVAFMKYKRIGDQCVKVQTDPTPTGKHYVSHDCQVCERSGGGSDGGKWSCSPVPEEPATGKPNCLMVLGPDCKRYLANKDDQSKPCV